MAAAACKRGGSLLNAKVLVGAARVVAGSQDEATVGLASMAGADHCRHSWRGEETPSAHPDLYVASTHRSGASLPSATSADQLPDDRHLSSRPQNRLQPMCGVTFHVGVLGWSAGARMPDHPFTPVESALPNTGNVCMLMQLMCGLERGHYTLCPIARSCKAGIHANQCVTFATPLAAAIRQMVATEGLVRYLPSPLTTKVQPEERCQC